MKALKYVFMLLVPGFVVFAICYGEENDKKVLEDPSSNRSVIRSAANFDVGEQKEIDIEKLKYGLLTNLMLNKRLQKTEEENDLAETAIETEWVSDILGSSDKSEPGTNKMNQILDDMLFEQDEDLRRSKAVNSQLRNYLEEKQFMDSYVQNVECGLKLCKIEIVHGDSEADKIFNNELLNNDRFLGSEESIFERTEEDGQLGNLIYLQSRQGVSWIEEANRRFSDR